jgi:hypothetical protein
MRPFLALIWVSLQKSVKVIFKSFRDSDVISSMVSELRSEKNSSSPMVRSELVYNSVRQRSGSQAPAFEVSAGSVGSR